MVLRYIYGGRLSLEEYDTLDIIKILVASNELEPEKVFNSIDFDSLSEQCLISLIQHNNLQMSVIQIWENVLKWNTLQHLIPFIKFLNLSHKEFLDKVYPYKKILPKDLRDNLIRHFIGQANIMIEKDFNIMIDEINDFVYKEVNEAFENKLSIQKVNEYFSNHNINVQEVYNWLLNNQVNANSIFLIGYFNLYGIATSKNNERTFNLFINASEKNHTLAQCFVGNYCRYVIENEKLSFEYYEKAASKNYVTAQLEIGHSYRKGIGIEKDFKKAFYWYEKAAKNGDIKAIYNLGTCYINGIGIKKDYNKAFELYKQSAEGGYSCGITMLGYCYNNGIGTKINKQKSFELYQDAANLENDVAQNNLALMSRYEWYSTTNYNDKKIEKKCIINKGSKYKRQKINNKKKQKGNEKELEKKEEEKRKRKGG
ncbi:kinase-like domain-containing protein [Rhizophagus clarus]|uniref:Kinase-like domain-containing protein n=1 Tax=Rhizophagus clarus TaxID=94130 RepID=A0A8H3MCX1_9GLOM|nr:kinase-like domain-containing protein [Rhizophagus clarus]